MFFASSPGQGSNMNIYFPCSFWCASYFGYYHSLDLFSGGNIADKKPLLVGGARAGTSGRSSGSSVSPIKPVEISLVSEDSEEISPPRNPRRREIKKENHAVKTKDGSAMRQTDTITIDSSDDDGHIIAKPFNQAAKKVTRLLDTSDEDEKMPVVKKEPSANRKVRNSTVNSFLSASSSSACHSSMSNSSGSSAQKTKKTYIQQKLHLKVMKLLKTYRLKTRNRQVFVRCLECSNGTAIMLKA